jgi:hypothetical protein
VSFSPFLFGGFGHELKTGSMFARFNFFDNQAFHLDDNFGIFSLKLDYVRPEGASLYVSLAFLHVRSEL